MIRDALKVMNKHASRYKAKCFQKFVDGTRLPVHTKLTKKQKKGVCALVQYYQLVTMRALFVRYAVNVQLFRCIRHPKTKYLASVQCLFRNFRRARERLGFFKLKKNLNM